jgi:HAAS domain-containing protein
MTTQVLHPLAADYLERLRAAARRLPRGRREELIADIEVHLTEAIAPDAGDAEALTVLDRLGTPEDIIEAEEPAGLSTDARGIHEWAAVILLLFGGFVVGVGWLVGLILLWSSRNWTVKEKWLGTLVVPGGWAAVWVVLNTPVTSGQSCVSVSGQATHCTGGPSTGSQILAFAVLAFFVLGPLFTAVFLARRAKTPPALRPTR